MSSPTPSSPTPVASTEPQKNESVKGDPPRKSSGLLGNLISSFKSSNKEKKGGTLDLTGSQDSNSSNNSPTPNENGMLKYVIFYFQLVPKEKMKRKFA